MVSLHETCQEYIRRRLKEGWRIVSRHGHIVVLENPEGTILRDVDLRNDTLTLVPNGVGDYTNIASQYPASGAHWDKVDDPPSSPDDTSTFVDTDSTTQQKDAYNLADTSQTGTINSVRVYFRFVNDWLIPAYAQPFLRLGTSETAGTEVEKSDSVWETYSQILARPGGGSWSWADINALQGCMGLRSAAGGGYRSILTQVYVEVNYTSAPSFIPRVMIV